jgi:hypothetical protein
MRTSIINGKSVKITSAGYLYIDGVRHDRKINPLYNGYNFTDDKDVKQFCHDWSMKNYSMI